MPLVKRLVKGSPLTFAEGDDNLDYLENLTLSSSADFNNWTGSSSSQFAGTASYATNALSASYLTGYVSPFPFTGSAVISGSLTVDGPITATTLVVQTITSSQSWITGSTKFGSINTNTHQFTGSVSISGSDTFGLNVNAGALYVSSSGNVGIGTTSPGGFKLDVNGAARVNGFIYLQNNGQIYGSTGYVTIPSVGLYIQGGRLQMASDIAIWNKAQTNFVTFAQRSTAFSEAVYNLSNVGNVNMVGALTISNVSSSINSISGSTLFTGSLGVTGSLSINQITAITFPILTISGSVSASSALAQGINLIPNLVASASNDVLVGLDINPTFTNGAFTGVTNNALRVQGIARIIGVDNNTINIDNAGTRYTTATLSNNGTGKAQWTLDNNTNLVYFGPYSTNGGLVLRSNGVDRMTIFGATGNISINTSTDAGFRLDIAGTARVQGKLTVSTGGMDLTGTLQNFSGYQGYGQMQLFSGVAFQMFNTANNSKFSIQYINASGLSISTNSELLSGVLKGIELGARMNASANNQTLVALDIIPTFTVGAFTGVSQLALRTQTGDVLFGTTSGNVAIGGGTSPAAKLEVSGSITAASAIARGVNFVNALSASANNDVLVGLDINPTFSTGSFTGVSNLGLRVGNIFNFDIANQSLNVINQTTTNANRGIAIYQNNTGVQGAAMQFFKSRGTNTSPSAVSANDLVGVFVFRPYIAGAYPVDRSLFGANMATSTGVGLFFIAGSTDGNYNPSLYIHPTNNVAIGSTQSILTGITDSGFRLDVSGSTRITNNLTVSGSTLLTGSLTLIGNTIITGSLTVVTGSSVELQVTNTGVKIGNVFTDINTVTGSLNISGSSNIRSSGSAVFSVDGTAGRLFQVDDSLSGSLFSVNTAAGLPIIEAFSDNTVRIGQFGQRVLFVSQSRVGIGKEVGLNANLDISGSAIITGSLNINQITATTTPILTISGSVSASSAIARGANLIPNLVASASNDVLVGLDINPTFTNGAFTGVRNVALRVWSSIDMQGATIGNIGSGQTLLFAGAGTGEIRMTNSSGAGFFYTYYTNGAERLRLAATTGNLLLNTTTDGGFRLDVNGTARVQGQLTVSTGGAAITGGITATSNGHRFGNLEILTTGTASGTGQGIVITGADQTFQLQGSSSPNISEVFRFTHYIGTTQTQSLTNSNKAFVRIYGGFTDGNLNNLSGNELWLSPTYNFAGTRTGIIVRGIYYNPTLTSLTNTTHRAIETETGDVIFGSTSGNVGIGPGKFTPNATLDVSGSIIVTGSLTVVTGSSVEFQVTNTGVKIGSAITDINTVTGSLNISGSVTITSGSITMPNRPAFRVYGAGTINNLSTASNGDGTLNQNNWTVDFQQGSALTGSTGIFTAPIAGLYSVHMICRNDGNANFSQLAVLKNNSTAGGNMVAMVEFAGSSTMNHAGASSITQLAVGDTLRLKVLANTITFDGNDSWAVAYIG